MHFQTQVEVVIGVDEARRLLAHRTHLVDEVGGVLELDFQRHAGQRLIFQRLFGDARDLTATIELLGQLVEGRADGALEGRLGTAALGEVEHVVQTLMPVDAFVDAAVVLTHVLLAVLDHQRLVHADHHEDQHDGEGHGGDHHGALQRAQAPDHQQCQRQQADDGGPEDAQPDRRIVVHVLEDGGEVGQYQSAGVGGGHEEHDTQNRHHGGGDGGVGQLLQEGVDGVLRCVQGFGGQCRDVLIGDHVDGGITEHAHPHHHEAQRNQQRAEHELTDGTATRDTRQEQADERGPGDPPAPEEQRPAAHPLIGTRGVGVGIEALGGELGDVVTDVEHQGVEQLRGVADGEHEDQQRGGQQHVELGQHADAFLDTGDHGNGRQYHHADDQRGLDGEVLGHAEHELEAVIQLDDADAQRGGDAEHGGDDREDVHGVADRAIDAVAEQRVEGRADRQRQAVAVAEVGQRHAGEHIDAPAGEAPVEEGFHHGIADRRLGLRVTGHRRHVVGQRFGDAVEQDVDADAGREQHRRPGQQREFRA